VVIVPCSVLLRIGASINSERNLFAAADIISSGNTNKSDLWEPTECFFRLTAGLDARAQIVEKLLVALDAVDVCELAC
jgi:hypothetical protein